jgi:predicted nucleic acid-binding Zn ribbon protein
MASCELAMTTPRRGPRRSGIQPLPTSDGHEPAKVGAGLDRLLRQLGGPGAGTLAALHRGWRDLVGEQIAAHAEPVSLRDRTLVVAVDDPAWGSQLRWLEAELTTQLTDALGEPVEAIEVRVRPR